LLFTTQPQRIINRFPEIVFAMSGTTSTRDLFDRYVVPTYGRFDLRFHRGAGREVWDENGKRYLDFGSGIAVTSVGHSHPKIVAAITEQAQTLLHVSNLYLSRPQALLAERIVRLMGGHGKVFFCNSGAEANEALYKLARKFGNQALGFSDSLPTPVGDQDTTPTPKFTIISMLNSFHGRTLAGIAATGQEKVRHGFEPLAQGFKNIPFNDLQALQESVKSDPSAAAILTEAIQGESGIRAASAEFLHGAARLAKQRNLLLLIDEVQAGFGRTGHWHGWEQAAPDLKPDAVSWAKGLGGGLPIGAVWISDREITLRSGDRIPLCNLLGPGSHGTTFGGTPFVSRGALEVLSIIEDEHLLENASSQGSYILSQLRALNHPLIKEVRGHGLLVGIELNTEHLGKYLTLPPGKLPAVAVVEKLQDAGLLTVPSAPATIRWLPALNVTREEIDEATRITASVLDSIQPRN
jgi:acetylornithine/succinyldiaminopimelate/putrescine aminotransferase